MKSPEFYFKIIDDINLRLEISHIRPPFWTNILLLCFILFFSIFPVVFVIDSLIKNEKLDAAMYLLFLFFALLISMFLRIILWNRYGKEIIIFTDNEVQYYIDYKYYKSRIKRFSLNSIKFYILNSKGELIYDKSMKGRLLIYLGKNYILLSDYMQVEDLRQLVSVLQQILIQFAPEYQFIMQYSFLFKN